MGAGMCTGTGCMDAGVCVGSCVHRCGVHAVVLSLMNLGSSFVFGYV